MKLWPLVPIALAIALLCIRTCTHETQLSRLAPTESKPTDPPGTRAYTGYLYVPRGGPVVIGTVGSTPSVLDIGRARLTAGAGTQKQRLLLDAKPVALRFAAAPGARLVWNPVGRRGDPEYIPPSLLSTSETATGRDAFLVDGIIALSLLLLLVGSLLFWQRARLAQVSRTTWLALAGVFAVALVARLVGLGDQGQTWDEDVNWAAGRNYIQNVLNGDNGARSWAWNYEHPPIMKYLAGIGAQLSPGFGVARAISAVVVALGCALLVPIGARLFDRRTGIIAGTIAALLPPLVAHGQIVGHEAPTVLWWALGILLALAVHDDLADRKTLIARLAGVGVVVGIAVASRFVNGLLGPLCVMIVLVRAPVAWRRATLAWSPIMVVTTVLTFWAVWPRLWFHPISALQQSLAKLDNAHAVEPFLGSITNTPAPYYFVVYLVATLPLGILLAALLGAYRNLRTRTSASLVLLGWLVIPLIIAASPVRQDGVRYVMPCVLALAMLAATGITFVTDRIRWPRGFLAATTALAVYLTITLYRVHPYYLDYFGEHIGGTGGAQRKGWFETAWWGEGLDRAVAYVNAHAPVNAKVDRSCVLPQHLTWFRADLWQPMVGRPQVADWIVEYVGPQIRCNVPPDARLVYAVTVQGATLARVWQRP